jgi:hypothetical protein
MLLFIIFIYFMHFIYYTSHYFYIFHAFYILCFSGHFTLGVRTKETQESSNPIGGELKIGH